MNNYAIWKINKSINIRKPFCNKRGKQHTLAHERIMHACTQKIYWKILVKKAWSSLYLHFIVHPSLCLLMFFKLSSLPDSLPVFYLTLCMSLYLMPVDDLALQHGNVGANLLVGRLDKNSNIVRFFSIKGQVLNSDMHIYSM